MAYQYNKVKMICNFSSRLFATNVHAEHHHFTSWIALDTCTGNQLEKIIEMQIWPDVEFTSCQKIKSVVDMIVNGAIYKGHDPEQQLLRSRSLSLSLSLLSKPCRYLIRRVVLKPPYRPFAMSAAVSGAPELKMFLNQTQGQQVSRSSKTFSFQSEPVMQNLDDPINLQGVRVASSCQLDTYCQ